MWKKLIVVVMVVGLVAVGCSSKKGTGALIGSGTGAAIGAVIGKQAGNTAVGAIIGAAVGGATGAAIGSYMDKQAAEMREDLAGARIERVGEGIKITFDSGILFDVNSATLQPAAQENLNNLAVILNKYEDTNILIEGHTDNTGTEEYNLNLSKRRADAVSYYLASHGVANPRVSVMPYGEGQPIADNSTAMGRQQNRRVELAIMANDKLKNALSKQAG